MGRETQRLRTSGGWAALFLALLLVAPSLWASESAVSKTLTVCPSGCDHATIQAAVDLAKAGDTILIRGSAPHNEAGIIIKKDLIVTGMGLDKTTVQAASSPSSAADRIFHLTSEAVVTIKDITLRHGAAGTRPGGGIFNDGGTLTLERVRLTRNNASQGGGLFSNGTAVIRDSKVRLNEISDPDAGYGAGIGANGTLVVEGSLVSYNTAYDQTDVGGIFCQNQLTLTDSVVEHNKSPGTGGVAVWGPARITNSTIRSNQGNSTGGGLFVGGESNIRSTDISSNSAKRGGGVYAPGAADVVIEHTSIRDNEATWNGGGLYVYSGHLFVVNSTVSGNQAFDDGGGIYVYEEGQASLANVTVSDNTADADGDDEGTGGGIYLGRQADKQGVAVLRNSIVQGNYDASPGFFKGTAPDCYRTLTSEGYNLVGHLGVSSVGGSHLCFLEGDLTGNLTGVSAQLGLLADNGGPTLTHALDSGSPVVDAGNPGGCRDFEGQVLNQDQRFITRANRCDMGAYEANALENRVYLPLVVRE